MNGEIPDPVQTNVNGIFEVLGNWNGEGFKDPDILQSFPFLRSFHFLMKNWEVNPIFTVESGKTSCTLVAMISNWFGENKEEEAMV